MGNKLASGDHFPEVVINTVRDGEISLPKAISSDFAVVIFYRGHW
jgi:hypothetical protein